MISPQSLHLSARQYRDEILGQHYLAMVMAESEWDDFFDKNTIQDYNVLSAEINRFECNWRASKTLSGVTQLKIGDICVYIYMFGRMYVIFAL